MKQLIIVAVVALTALTAFDRSNKQIKMKSRFTTLTLGVDNLDRSFKFYHEGLGFPSKGVVGKEFEHALATNQKTRLSIPTTNRSRFLIRRRESMRLQRQTKNLLLPGTPFDKQLLNLISTHLHQCHSIV